MLRTESGLGLVHDRPLQLRRSRNINFGNSLRRSHLWEVPLQNGNSTRVPDIHRYSSRTALSCLISGLDKIKRVQRSSGHHPGSRPSHQMLHLGRALLPVPCFLSFREEVHDTMS